MAGESVSLDDVEKSFATAAGRVEVLAGVSLDLPPGGALAVTGPSGSGKSTLLHLIGTLDRPTAGTIRIGGSEPHRLAEPQLARFRNRTIGFVFQDHHLLPQFSLLENVLLPALAFPDRNAAEIEGRARDLLQQVGLGERLAHRPAELSGGERQRAAVARALVLSPGLLLCDEPTGSLDGRSAATVADLLLALQEAEGTTLLVVTHSLDLAARLPRRAELAGGRLHS